MLGDIMKYELSTIFYLIGLGTIGLVGIGLILGSAIDDRICKQKNYDGLYGALDNPNNKLDKGYIQCYNEVCINGLCHDEKYIIRRK